MPSSGFGLVWTSDNLGATWTSGPSTYGALVIDAQLTPMVSVPVAGVGAIVIGIPNVDDFCVYRNGKLLERNDGTGNDFAYNSTTEMATLAVGLRTGDVIRVDLALTMTTVLTETPSGTVNGTNPTFTTAHTPATSVAFFVNGRALELGVDYTVSGSTITCVTRIPQTGQKLRVQYGY